MMGLGVKEVSEVIATLEVIDDTWAGEINSKTNVVNFDNFGNFDNFSSNFDNFDNFGNFDNFSSNFDNSDNFKKDKETIKTRRQYEKEIIFIARAGHDSHDSERFRPESRH